MLVETLRALYLYYAVAVEEGGGVEGCARTCTDGASSEASEPNLRMKSVFYSVRPHEEDTVSLHLSADFPFHYSVIVPTTITSSD